MKVFGKTWDYFSLNELFPVIYKPNAYNAIELQFHRNGVRYITRTENNNGCKGYVINDDLAVEAGNAITIGDTTATIFYQQEDFICGEHIIVLRAPWLNRDRGLFVVSVLQKERFRYTYGRPFKREVIDKAKIKLPIVNDDDIRPDWNWIDNYMCQLQCFNSTSKVMDIYNGTFDRRSFVEADLVIEPASWKSFPIQEIFTHMEKCKCSNATDLLNAGNDIAYIGAKKKENGVMRYVKYDESLVTKGNCIVFIGDGQGSVGYCLYQPNDFIGSTTLIAGYNDFLNIYTALFLVSVFDLERYRYSFGRKYNKNAIINSKIKLPVDANGNPNWQFMEDYIKSLPYSKNIE